MGKSGCVMGAIICLILLVFIAGLSFMSGIILAIYSLTDRLANGDKERQLELLEMFKQGE